MSKLAVIDIGSNSIHMVLADIQPDGSYQIVDRYKDMCRLGDGAFADRSLSERAMVRGLEVIRTLVTLARNKGFDRIEAVATSAVREARNGGVFIGAVAEQTGLHVRVISGLEEARLIFLGVRHGIALTDEPVLVVDIGGGSVELMVGTRQSLLYAKSLKLGAIRVVEEYLPKTPPSDAMRQRLEGEVTRQLKAALEPCKVKRFAAVIATSGMAGNLAEVIHLQRTGRPLLQQNLATVTQKELSELEQLLARSSTRARLAIPGLDPKRVDTLFPAVMVLRRLLELVQADELTVCDKAIREGVIFDFIAKHQDKIQAERDIPDVRRRSVLALVRRCHAPEVHSLHVASLALRLFDQTKRLHGLGDAERAWLEYAAMLHDVGYLINVRQHHKHSYYVIKHSDLTGFTAEEIELIANIARYHRRALPASKHAPYDSLTPRHRRTIRILSALLRVADALDRTHFSIVQTLNVRLGPTITIVLFVSGDAELETWAAKGRADLLEQVFRRPVVYRVAAQEEATA
ncbi:Ppx/GppA phosphatase family protein [Nitrospira moscoviensis]|uniref:Putative Exopolyphosphatase n=1 Tax=Nitrospira moscoviensis TaxID=42253 RepID=A0A0K2GJB3_NITMO|nr:Ppx/GppA phosphatase family protein [Nitrospira moscoviensis]ALA61031.1 putative Exopolyphosphatase [Nitrospira moscoviensis]